eukprot:m.188027 g.188027  ORF g.188027 m.188027 type:complete len:499 (+) comp17274_c0_seq1:348-1844(+)
MTSLNIYDSSSPLLDDVARINGDDPFEETESLLEEGVSDKLPPLDPDLVEPTRTFLLQLTGALMSYGAPAHSVESLSGKAGLGFKLRVEVQAFPSWFLARTSVNLTNATIPHIAASDTVTMHRVGCGLDVCRLEDTVGLAKKVAKSRLTLNEAQAELHRILNSQALYPMWLRESCFGVCAMCCTLLFNGGSFADSALALLGGIIVGLLCMVASTYDLGNALEFICAFLIAGINRAIATYAFPDQVCFFAPTFGALVWLFPGMGIANAVLEIAGNSPIAGTARFFQSVVIFLMIGFGLAIGSRAGTGGEPVSIGVCHAPDSTHSWVLVLSFIGVFCTYAVLLNMSLRQMPSAFLIQIISFSIAKWGVLLVDNDAATMLAAVGVGLSSNALSAYTKRPAYTNIVMGILVLLPGALGVRGATAIIDNDYVSASSFGSTMLVTLVSVTIGLGLAQALSTITKHGKQLRAMRWFMMPLAVVGHIRPLRPFGGSRSTPRQMQDV